MKCIVLWCILCLKFTVVWKIKCMQLFQDEWEDKEPPHEVFRVHWNFFNFGSWWLMNGAIVFWLLRMYSQLKHFSHYSHLSKVRLHYTSSCALLGHYHWAKALSGVSLLATLHQNLVNCNWICLKRNIWRFFFCMFNDNTAYVYSGLLVLMWQS